LEELVEVVEEEVLVEAVLVPTGLQWYSDSLVQKLTAAMYSLVLALLLAGLLVVGFVWMQQPTWLPMLIAVAEGKCSP
jgi:TctA family transporter